MVILPTTYFGSVDWYRQIACTKDKVVYIEAHENYVKQTERNRCYIATANGKQVLTVPVAAPPYPPHRGEGEKSRKPLISEIKISDHGNWRHNHWEALKTAYGMSPFFDFYQDEIRPFYEELPPYGGNRTRSYACFARGRGERLLFEFNLAITKKMLELLGIDKELQPTNTFQGLQASPLLQGEGSGVGLYYQTFQRRNGFIPGLSILDLLFNEGPAAILFLKS